MSEGYVPGNHSVPFGDPSSFPFDVTTEHVYAMLPEVIHLTDEQQSIPSSGKPLKRWMRGICGVMDDVEVLIARINYLTKDERVTQQLTEDWVTYSRRTDPFGSSPIGETSDLVDPVSADNLWLDWLGQLVGASLLPLRNEQERRDAVAFASAGYKAGSKQAIADAARSELTGTRHVEVYDHSINVPGDGGQWDVLLITKVTETPGFAALVETIIRKGVKPAGVVLHHRSFESTWDAVEATWDVVEARGSWRANEEVGL